MTIWSAQEDRTLVTRFYEEPEPTRITSFPPGLAFQKPNSSLHPGAVLAVDKLLKGDSPNVRWAQDRLVIDPRSDDY